MRHRSLLIAGIAALLLVWTGQAAADHTWTEQTASGSRMWFCIASSSDGTKLAAGLPSGYIHTGVDEDSGQVQ